MQGTRGCPTLDLAGWLMGEGRRRATPFRLAPSLLRGTLPSFGEGKGRMVGRSRAWRARDFPGLGARTMDAALNDPGGAG